MTNEEKVYIASFNDKEFALFIKFLKMKDREIKWQGNVRRFKKFFCLN